MSRAYLAIPLLLTFPLAGCFGLGTPEEEAAQCVHAQKAVAAAAKALDSAKVIAASGIDFTPEHQAWADRSVHYAEIGLTTSQTLVAMNCP